MVFAKTQIVSPYFLYTISPRCLISPDCATVISQLHLNGSVLVVEENEDAPDPLMLFDEQDEVITAMHPDYHPILFAL